MALGLALSATATPALASPPIHAHRGGALVEGVPTYPENSLPALAAAASGGFILEFDVKLSADDVPVVIHDPTLDRTTDCTGRVDALTAAQLRAQCRVDILGTDDNSVQLGPGDSRRAVVPTLAEVLDLAVERGASINVEVKNAPTDPDFDLSGVNAGAVASAIESSGIPRSRVIVQSFWPLDLVVVKARLPDVDASLLTLAALNEAGPAGATAIGAEWFSPGWPVSSVTIAEAHALGRQVVPYTLDSEGELGAAIEAGADALISNDPTRARRVGRALEPPAPPSPPPPSDGECAAARASRTSPAISSYDPEPGAPRVFAMQPKQELRHVVTYRAFRTKIECMVREQVVPRMASGRPNVIAFNEDIGLMTIATGSRGTLSREIFGDFALAPVCEPIGVPCGTLGALAAAGASYTLPLALYRLRFPLSGLLSSPFVAATDTFARGWMQTFSDIAKRYGVYIVGSANQAPFRESRDPSEIAAFADPDQPPPSSVYIATSGEVFNEVFMWGPDDVRVEGPRPLRNVVASNKKVPLTPIEQQLQMTPGPASGPDAIENLRPFRIPGTEARVGFATSLPAFIYGHAIGEPAPLDPCTDAAVFYMACMDRLGANLVIQDEANPGRWAGPSGEGNWQPLEWMRSTWRAAADPAHSFAYNVTPHLVGNLSDLPFDGQTAITQRGLGGPSACTYVGNSSLIEGDPGYLAPYAGPKPEFLALAPWVSPDAPRADLRETARRLAPGSGDPLENDYLETAVVADLPFPPDPGRGNCNTSIAPAAVAPAPAATRPGGNVKRAIRRCRRKFRRGNRSKRAKRKLRRCIKKARKRGP